MANTRVGTTLLREIQAAATEASTSVAVVLRKAQILAARLDHQPLKDWVSWELNGYPDDQPLPEYRRLGKVQVLGDFSGAFGSSMNNAPIAEGSLPEWTREYLFTQDMYAGVAELESLVDQGANAMQSPWPTDVVAVYAQQMYEGMVCLSAWRVVSRGSLVAILDAVRNKVLAFALEIEAADPGAGEAEPGQPPLDQGQVTQIFTTNIYGGQATVAAGNRDVSQHVVQVQPVENWDRLRGELEELGVEPEDVAELKSALDADTATTPPGTLGPQTQSWLGRLATKASTGTIRLAEGVSIEMVAGVVTKALGMG